MAIKNEVEVVDIAGFSDLIGQMPTLDEERWRIIDEGDRWVVWCVPLSHSNLWKEVASCQTEQEAIDYVKAC